MTQNLIAAQLKDEQKEAFFQKYGYVHIENFISQEKVDKLLQTYSILHDRQDRSKSMWNSLYDLDYEKSLSTSQTIKDIVTESFVEHFKEFEVPIATFMVKNPTEDSECKVHRDFTVFDENNVQFRNYWIPLIDITTMNGALYVIPGSYHLFNEIRPMFTDWAYESLEDDLMPLKKLVYPKAGDLILYADRTLHGSLKNKTNITRPVVHGGILPRGSELHYFQQKDSSVNKFKVNFDFYLKNDFDNINKNPSYKLVEQFNFTPKKINLNDLKLLDDYIN